MTGDAPQSDLPAVDLRARVVDRLTELFAADALTLEQFESRLDLAHRTESTETLQQILAGLQQTGSAGTRRVAVRTVPAGVPKERSIMLGFWGGSSRSGAWTPARHNYVVAFQGGAELDLREARFGPGVTTITVFCAMGGVNIIAPPDLQIDFGGIGIMGGFEIEPDAQWVSDPSSPVVRVRGVAIWGGAGVEIRRPGESASEARQRRRLAKRLGKELPPGDPSD